MNEVMVVSGPNSSIWEAKARLIDDMTEDELRELIGRANGVLHRRIAERVRIEPDPFDEPAMAWDETYGGEGG